MEGMAETKVEALPTIDMYDGDGGDADGRRDGDVETKAEALPKGGMHSGKGDGGNANNGMTEVEVMPVEGMCDVDGDGDGTSGRCDGSGRRRCQWKV